MRLAVAPGSILVTAGGIGAARKAPGGVQKIPIQAQVGNVGTAVGGGLATKSNKLQFIGPDGKP